MKGIIWLWKHRHCWEQLRYLYSHRFELKRILAKVPLSEEAKGILTCLHEFDRVPLARPIPRRPLYNERIERALVLPTGGGENSFSAELDPAKEKPKRRTPLYDESGLLPSNVYDIPRGWLICNSFDTAQRLLDVMFASGSVSVKPQWTIDAGRD